ncbi:MAG: putative selenate ABC transporter substrate-binding protein [Cyanobacteria bacterium QH_6_48_35]|jgi:phosphonate transport system substrate-binding protein|nr:MAG: putative selenate ABC transporter substrate-binding protein [Cyanobacteria bacterium QH_1_48_107]PSO58992.1 MAG: putative selenate ABC transporter substrate-binding protein [Cyanobacteria bacterium QH_10_48_56]PSO61860.1 MAG: putative selenate ABC transporter substrate-binding protein [Cyanobacteria bacterium QH_6_48_35]PSO67284.1 MAG: putative selenate ABC transporter substrate-binding protein [Cyanobacteria bacterium QH_7_48_89]PSO93646.1 MAG: putative selenate ABC transporter substra
MFPQKKFWLFGLLLLLLLPVNACSFSSQDTPVKPLITGAIPDQDPEQLQRLYSKLADYLEAELGIPVAYKPVTNYAAAVTAFRVGELDLVWFGGLTGVQARLQVEGAKAIAQRAIDDDFTSVFIANQNSDISPINSINGLDALKGHTFTFGSQSSTSGRLMPQYFLQKAGVTLEEFQGKVGFSGSHDKTIQLVEAGSYEAGALNSQVWRSRVEQGKVNLKRVEVIWETPEYYDYHWVIHPDVKERYGEDFPQRVQKALLKLDPSNPQHQEILDLFGANKFVPSKGSNYARIEKIARQIGKIK